MNTAFLRAVRRFSVLVVLVISTWRIADGATYFVAPGGNDANPGAEALPWRTLEKAARSVQPGDIVRIKAGAYATEKGWTVTRAGTAENPITYRAYGDGEVRVSNSTAIAAGSWKHFKGRIYATTLPGSARYVYVFQNGTPLLCGPSAHSKINSVDDMVPNSAYLSGSTLYVWLEDGSDPKKSAMRVSDGHVVSLYNCHYTIFDGLTVEFGYNGFKDQGKNTHHVTYRNCTIRSIGSQGIQPVPQDAVIERNLFQKIGASKFLHGIYNSKPRLIVRYNVFEEIAGAGIHQYNQSQPAGGECRFYGNVFRKPRKMTLLSGGSRTAYYTDIIAWGVGNNLIYNNVFYDEGKRTGISLNSAGSRVYNNTFVNTPNAIQFHDGKPDNQVFNNILLSAGKPLLVWPKNSLPQKLDYNLYYSSGAAPRWQRDGVALRSFELYQKASGESHSVYVDPKLAGPADARLTTGSPAIDAGIALKEVAVDREGIVRPQGAAYDIGAYEFQAK